MPAHRVEQAHVRDRDARNLPQALAQHARHLVHAALAVLAVHQAHVNAGVDLALRAAGVNGRERVAHLGQAAHHGLDLLRLGLGGLDGRAHGHVEVDGSFGEIGLGHELGAQQRHHDHAEHKNARRHGQRGQLVHQRPAQDVLVRLDECVGGVVEPAGHTADGLVIESDGLELLPMGVNARIFPNARQHGVEREADKHRYQHRRHDGDAELVEELADDAAHEANRQEHRHDRQRGRQHGQADLLRAVHGRLVAALAHLHMAHDVLAHHDGVVDQKAHAQAQRHQRDHVDGEAEHVHEQKGADQRNRQRQPRDDRGAPGVQEQKDDEHGEQSALDQRLAHVVHRHPDGARVVANRL